MMTAFSTGRRLAAEALGTGLLVATVVGSGIMGESLAAGNKAVALLANTLATGAGLFTLIYRIVPDVEMGVATDWCAVAMVPDCSVFMICPSVSARPETGDCGSY